MVCKTSQIRKSQTKHTVAPGCSEAELDLFVQAESVREALGQCGMLHLVKMLACDGCLVSGPVLQQSPGGSIVTGCGRKESVERLV